MPPAAVLSGIVMKWSGFQTFGVQSRGPAVRRTTVIACRAGHRNQADPAQRIDTHNEAPHREGHLVRRYRQQLRSDHGALGQSRFRRPYASGGSPTGRRRSADTDSALLRRHHNMVTNVQQLLQMSANRTARAEPPVLCDDPERVDGSRPQPGRSVRWSMRCSPCRPRETAPCRAGTTRQPRGSGWPVELPGSYLEWVAVAPPLEYRGGASRFMPATSRTRSA